MRAQTRTDFTWRLACRKDVPEETRRRIAVYEADGTSATYENRSFAGVVPSLGDARYLITSRLDSDDAICPHYVERVHGAFDRFRASGRPTGIHIFGLERRLDARSGEIYERFNPKGSFVSLFVDLEQSDPVSVYHLSHREIASHHGLDLDTTHAGGLLVVHGENVFNKIRPEDKKLGRNALAGFEDEPPVVRWDRIWTECTPGT